MRKIYTFFLVALLMPLLAVAQDYNKSLTFADRTTFYVTGDDIVGVDLDVMGEGTTTATLAEQSFSMGTWFRLSKLPDYTVQSYQFGNAILMGYRGLNHMNSNGCVTIGYQRDSSKLKLYGFGWSRMGVGEQLIDAALTVGEWHFVAFSVDYVNKVARVFLDDAQVGEYTITGNHGTFEDTPEAYSFGGFGSMGAIDDSFIYNTALTLDDVKKIIAGRPDAVAGLKGWYTFDEVKAGTTNAFANKAEGSDIDAIYYRYTGSAAESGLISGSLSTGTPDLSTITAETARQLPVVDCKFTVPSASDFENVEALTFTADGQQLTAGETVTLLAGTEITVNVTPAAGYTVAEIVIDGTVIANGSTFAIKNDVTAADITIRLASGSFALTVANESNIPYTLKTAAGADVDLTSVLEGTSLQLTLDVPFAYTLDGVTLGTETLTATDGVYTFAMPGENATLTIRATEKTKYTVTIAQPDGGTLSVSLDGTAINSGDKVIPGQILTVTATPDADHLLRKITANGSAINGSTFEMPAADVTFAADFAVKDSWNKSITYINTTSPEVSPEDRVDVEHDILGVSSQSELSTRSISIGAWVRMTRRLSSGNVIFNYGGLNHNNGNGLMVLRTDANGVLTIDGFGVKDRLGFGNAQSLGTTLPLNEWHYVALAADFTANEIRFYYDGELAKTLTFNAGKAFGSFDDSPWGFGFGQVGWNGSMDDIHIIDGAISDSDALNLYTDNADKVEGLVGWYTFDEVKEGTTNHFANQVEAKSAYDAIYYSIAGTYQSWAGGITDNTRNTGTPDMEFITIDLQRPIMTKELENERTVTVASANEALGTVSIVSPATEDNSVTTKEKNVTVKATPAADAAFMNWTDANGDVVSTDASYTYKGETDIELTANFGYSLNFTVGSEGSAVVKVNGTIVSTGNVYAPSAEVEITVSVPAGKQYNIDINGSTIYPESDVYTFTLEANAEVKVQFVDRINRITYTVTGNGSVEIWTELSESEGIPAGQQLFNGDIIPADAELYIYFIPDNSGDKVYKLGDVIVNNGGDESKLEPDMDYYRPIDGGNCDETDRLAYAYLYPLFTIDGDINLSVEFVEGTQGIEEIGIDPADGPVEYYNLQGVRVAADNFVPGFYILRQGAKTAKVLIRK